MTCPFGAVRKQSFSHQDEEKKSGDPISLPRKLRQERFSSHTWNSGPSMEIAPPVVEPPAGVVQKRVSSFLNMIKSSSAPPTLIKEKLPRPSRSIACCRSKELEKDLDEPLFPIIRDIPDKNQTLTLQRLTEAVWNFITIPSDHLLHALDGILKSGEPEWKTVRRKLRIVAGSMLEWDDWHLDDLLCTLVKQLDTSLELFMDALGQEYVRECRKYYEKALLSLGLNLEGFLTTLISVCDLLKSNTNQQLKTKNDVPNLLLGLKQEQILLHFQTNREQILYFIQGVIIGVSEQLFNKKVQISSDKCNTRTNIYSTRHRYHYKYTIKQIICRDASMVKPALDVKEQLADNYGIEENTPGQQVHVASQACHLNSLWKNTSPRLDHISDTKISVGSFCQAFPWHFVCNRQMRCIQMGSGLHQVFGPSLLSEKRDVSTCFSVVSPEGVPLSYDSISTRLSTPFVLAFKCHRGSRVKVQDMQLKGQMIDCPETISLLFVGSPLLDGMDALTSHGLYLSDIPLHDATRDVILVGEQSRAQHGVKRRMAQLKDSILKANQAVDEEREKNVSLLHLIFPPDIAKRLWLGESFEAQKHTTVSMLFSDIVGFTSICSTASPLTVIDILQNLYTKFDAYCGYFDVYKVETIGDAYCVAGNLHRTSRHHAQRVTWMALRMIDTCTAHRTHLGEPIKMRIGIHTGPVLAGVVGTTMPRFCLFGSNVTLANSFESTSEPLKINISPTTYRMLLNTAAFHVTERPSGCLPKAFPRQLGNSSYFVEDYQHPEVAPELQLIHHIEKAVQELDSSSS